jgi:HAD superfamily hydrolase (TIGR01509 family)
MATRSLVIFAVDGALVDNAHLRAQVWSDVLADFGYRVDPPTAARRFSGRDDRAVVASVEAELGRPLGRDVLAAYNRRLAEIYRRELTSVRDVLGTIRRLRRPVCAVSGAERDSARLALEVAGLWPVVAPNLFTASHVTNPPPASDLYQCAAAQMGVPVGRCLLVDANETGVRGGRAAGMTVFGFAGGGHREPPAQAERLRAAGAQLVFDRMSELAPLTHARAAA